MQEKSHHLSPTKLTNDRTLFPCDFFASHTACFMATSRAPMNSIKPEVITPVDTGPLKPHQRIFVEAIFSSGVIDALTPEAVKALYKELSDRGYFAPAIPDVPPIPVDTSAADLSKQLGPTFAELNPGATDSRPTIYAPPSRPATGPGIDRRVNPFEVGVTPVIDSDFWSCVGQVAYVPDEPAGFGLDRVQSYAYYCHVYATSPRFDGQPEPMAKGYWYDGLNVEMKRPVCAVRNYAGLSNEALVVYRNGYMGIAGTQTSRAGTDWPIPGLQLPATKEPRAIALTSYNEFALVAVHDRETGKGQLAVIACEGKAIPFHTLPFIALPNQGSWTDFRLLGFIDLPFAYPDSVSAATNGAWNGPSQTGGKTLGQIDITQDGTRWGMRQGEMGWQAVVAKSGYAIVSSKTEGKASFVDLSPLMMSVRKAYLDDATQKATLAAVAAKTFPGPLTAATSPVVTKTLSVDKPTCVLAGCLIDRWSPDLHKAYIASESGNIQIWDTSYLINRWEFERAGPLVMIGQVQVGRNPVSLCFARFEPYGLPLLPKNQNGTQSHADPLNNLFHAVCRGDRRIDSVITLGGAGQIYQTIEDARLIDPVHGCVSDRGNILTVCDYAGKQIVNYRIGPLFDRVDEWGKVGVRWDCGPTGHPIPFECGGVLALPGRPFWAGFSNLN